VSFSVLICVPDETVMSNTPVAPTPPAIALRNETVIVPPVEALDELPLGAVTVGVSPVAPASALTAAL
jgi:hypothetical protein